MFKPNVQFKGPIKMNVWRKVAIATWATTKDPTIYGFVDIDATPLLKTIEDYKSRGIRLTPTVIMAKALATGITRYPSFNTVLRFGKLYERKTIDIFLQVSAPEDGEENLSGAIIRDVNNKSLELIMTELQAKAEKIRAGNDPEFQKIKKDLGSIPSWVIGKFLNFVSFFNYGLNLWTPLMGTPRDSLGSAMITSVGGMGIEFGFAPLVPYSRCPMVMTVGKITEKAVVENGQIVIKSMLPISASMDHRQVDGFGGSKMFNAMLDYLKNPN